MTVPGARRSFWNLPDLLEADRVGRHVGLVAELECTNQLLGEIPAHAVREDRDLGEDVRTWLEVRLLLAVPPDAFVARAHTHDRRAIEQHRLARKAREQVDTRRFDELAHPLGDLVERDDVVAVVPERRRRDRQPKRPPRRQEVDVVLTHLAFERRRRREVRHELGQRRRIQERARERVRADLARFFEDGNRQRIAAFPFLQLGKTKRRREAAGPPADDQHVDFELVARWHGTTLSRALRQWPGRSRRDHPESHSRRLRKSAPRRPC